MNTKKYLCQFGLALALVSGFASVGQAAPVPANTPILIVDGLADANTTVIPDVVNPLPGFDFGQVVGGTFSQIIANSTVLQGGSLVDFAIQDQNNLNVYSLINPGATGVTTTLSGMNLSGSEQVPASVGSYFNTLTMLWTIGQTSVPFNIQVLNAGANNDGFAAVPIPAAAVLFGTGLAGLVGIARRKGLLK